MNGAPEHDQQWQEQIDLAIAEYLDAMDSQHPFDQQRWLDRYNAIRGELLDFLASEKEFGAVLDSSRPIKDQPGELTTDMPNAMSIENGPIEDVPTQDRLNRNQRTRIGPYILKRLLGAGGMGQVFEAADSSGNLVALKLLSPRWMRSRESLLRFKQEGKIASTINHPRCVFVKAADEDQGQPYIVMELMTGKTLKDLSQESGPLSVTRAVHAIIDVLDGLDEAHAHGMIHRDIKPANCYLESNGRVKVGDFGLARSMISDSDLTQTGDFIGTPLFASPEQVKGLPVDLRTDIYSVCATLYYLLSGRAPFAGSSPTSVIAKIVSEDPTPLRELNPHVPILLERVILRGLQRDRKMRFGSVGELRQALEPFLTGRDAIAAWGRRFAAYGLDSTLNGIYSVIAIQFLQHDNSQYLPPFGTYACLLFPVLAYQLVCEGWGNATIGKWLLRLHVVSQSTGEKPPRWQLIWRTVVAILMMGALSDLLLYAFADQSNFEQWVAIQWTGYLASYVLLLSPWFFARRSRLLLHDWISGTMVVDRPKMTPQQQLAGVAADYRIPLLASTGYPSKLGDFIVNGLISSNESMVVLSGRDESLGRSVWLYLRPLNEPGLSDARRNCDRTTRLRWLQRGQDGKWQWDAFLAYHGAPLKHWSAPDSPLPWKDARGILRQLAEELDRCRTEGADNVIQSLDQVWLDSRGRVVVVDWPPTDGWVISQENGSSIDESNSAILREAARLTLCGISRPLSDPPNPISAIVPVHVRNMLRMLTVGGNEPPDMSKTAQFLIDMDSNSQKSTEASFESRLLGLGFAIVPALMLLGIMASISRIGNQLILDKLSDQMVAPVAVDWLLKPGNEGDFEKVGELVQDFPSRDDLQHWQDNRSQRESRLSQEYHDRYTSLGPFSVIVANGANLTAEPSGQLKNVNMVWERDELMAVNWQTEGARSKFPLELLARLVRDDSDVSAVRYLRRSPMWLIGLTLIPFLTWIVWAGLTRGGMGMWVSGLRVVDSDGCPVNWIIGLLRSIVAGVPFLALQGLIVTVDLYSPANLWLSMIAYQILPWLFIVYAILILAFPRRAPHAWLLGTYLVPR